MRESEQRVYRSDYFRNDDQQEGDLFFSYTTCNSTEDDWIQFQEESSEKARVLDGVDIKAAIPSCKSLLTDLFQPPPECIQPILDQTPYMFKYNETGEIILKMGDEYYNNSVKFDGAYVHFAQKVVELSSGDIGGLELTHKSKVGSIIHPYSSFTAAVQDIKDGLVDMGIGPFWITSDRLKMTSFTMPLVYDKTYLVIPKPSIEDVPLGRQIGKVLDPFESNLWGLIILVIIICALLSVWFSDRSQLASQVYKKNVNLRQSKQPMRRRKAVYARLALDSILEKFTYFFSAGIEQDQGSSLPNKLLHFGFGFFILIAVSAYVANLAGFLIRDSVRFEAEAPDNMKEAISKKFPICAHSAIEDELRKEHPDAIWIFANTDNILKITRTHNKHTCT